ncbi:hypothetical protein DUNSADRAFT_2765, partial [Dunaliella salina]
MAQGSRTSAVSWTLEPPLLPLPPPGPLSKPSPPPLSSSVALVKAQATLSSAPQEQHPSWLPEPPPLTHPAPVSKPLSPAQSPPQSPVPQDQPSSWLFEPPPPKVSRALLPPQSPTLLPVPKEKRPSWPFESPTLTRLHLPPISRPLPPPLFPPFLPVPNEQCPSWPIANKKQDPPMPSSQPPAAETMQISSAFEMLLQSMRPHAFQSRYQEQLESAAPRCKIRTSSAGVDLHACSSTTAASNSLLAAQCDSNSSSQTCNDYASSTQGGEQGGQAGLNAAGTDLHACDGTTAASNILSAAQCNSTSSSQICNSCAGSTQGAGKPEAERGGQASLRRSKEGRQASSTRGSGKPAAEQGGQASLSAAGEQGGGCCWQVRRASSLECCWRACCLGGPPRGSGSTTNCTSTSARSPPSSASSLMAMLQLSSAALMSEVHKGLDRSRWVRGSYT